MARRRKAAEMEDESYKMSTTRSSENRMTLAQRWRDSLIYLGILASIIWILIGLYILPILLQSIVKGQYSQLIGFNRPEPTMAPVQQQTEADLPGIGKVNIACAQQALSADALTKVATERKLDSLSEDEKKKFQACIVAPESASPQATGSAQP